jgi:hypothetical protein
MVKYPSGYKIHGIELMVNSHRIDIKRRTGKLLDMLAKIGGLMRVLTVLIGGFVSYFSSWCVLSLMAKEMFTWHKPESY